MKALHRKQEKIKVYIRVWYIRNFIHLIMFSVRWLRHSRIQDSQYNKVISSICLRTLDRQSGYLSYRMASSPALEYPWVMDFITRCLIHSRCSWLCTFAFSDWLISVSLLQVFIDEDISEMLVGLPM